MRITVRLRTVATVIAAVTVLASLGCWYWSTRPTQAQRTAAAIRVDGYLLLGRSFSDGDTGSHPSTNSAGNLFYGPILQGDVTALVTGLHVRWETNLIPVPFGDRDLIARGQQPDGCSVAVLRLRRNVPAGLLTGASNDQVALFQAGKKDILDVGVVCPGAP